MKLQLKLSLSTLFSIVCDSSSLFAKIAVSLAYRILLMASPPTCMPYKLFKTAVKIFSVYLSNRIGEKIYLFIAISTVSSLWTVIREYCLQYKIAISVKSFSSKPSRPNVFISLSYCTRSNGFSK